MKEITNYEEYLEKNGTLTYSNVGTSMMPLLRQGKDLFTVTRKGPERCKAGDVVLYNSNQMVLFYGSNSWSYTRLGRIQYDSLDELKSFLKAGQGDISVTLSL